MLAIGIGRAITSASGPKTCPTGWSFSLPAPKPARSRLINTAYKADELDYILKQSDMKMLGLIDGFRDVDYIQIINQLVPELKEQARGFLNSAAYPHLKYVCYVGQEKFRGMYTTAELMLLGDHQRTPAG